MAMRYAIWMLRLGYAAWLVPAGLNHFYPLFPQPMGNQPESTALITALIESGLFTIVKAVELLAGICLLIGWRVPLALVVLIPVSFNVWYWDAPLEGWDSRAAIYGWAVLLSALALMLTYHRSYAALLEPKAAPRWPPALAAGGTRPGWYGPVRLVLGALLVLFALNHNFAWTLPFPVGATPMGLELLEALHVSRLINVAMGLMLLAGLALLAGRWVPLALAAVMPVLVCLAFWAVILEGSLGWSVLALALVALSALLMFAHLPSYAGMLEPRPLAAFDTVSERFENRYGWPVGGLGLGAAGMALVPLVLAAAFYHFIVPSLLAFYCILTLAYPLAVLLLRTLQGVGKGAGNA